MTCIAAGRAWRKTSMVLSGLFLAAFLAATLIPAQSELVLAAMVASGSYPVWAVVAVATTGNVLGSVVNWLLGRGAAELSDRRWFPVSPMRLKQVSDWYRRWGYWSLLAAWVPLIGDPLTVAAGTLREPLWRFLCLVTIAKGGRYVLLAAAVLGIA